MLAAPFQDPCSNPMREQQEWDCSPRHCWAAVRGRQTGRQCGSGWDGNIKLPRLALVAVEELEAARTWPIPTKERGNWTVAAAQAEIIPTCRLNIRSPYLFSVARLAKCHFCFLYKQNSLSDLRAPTRILILIYAVTVSKSSTRDQLQASDCWVGIHLIDGRPTNDTAFRRLAYICVTAVPPRDSTLSPARPRTRSSPYDVTASKGGSNRLPFSWLYLT